MDLEKQILSCKNLTPAEQRIGRFILESPSEIITMTGKEMEMRLYVSKSAIYRFCKKIGVEGFNELKLEIASLARGMTDDERIDGYLPIFHLWLKILLSESAGSLDICMIRPFRK